MFKIRIAKKKIRLLEKSKPRSFRMTEDLDKNLKNIPCILFNRESLKYHFEGCYIITDKANNPCIFQPRKLLREKEGFRWRKGDKIFVFSLILIGLLGLIL